MSKSLDCLEKRIDNVENKLMHMAQSNLDMGKANEIILKQQEKFLEWLEVLKKAFADSGYQF